MTFLKYCISVVFITPYTIEVCLVRFFFFKILFIFREEGREGEREEEKHQCVVASHAPPTGDLAHNPGMGSRLGIELATLWFSGRHSVH